MIFPKVDKYPSRDMRQLLPTAQESLKKILAECVKRGIRIFLTCTYRSGEYQHKEFLEGSSKLDSGFSMHEFRIAVDIACKGKELYNLKTLEAAAAIFKSHGWLWGGDWNNNGRTDDEKFRDWMHFQFVTLAEQKKIYTFKTLPESKKWESIDKYLKVRKK